MNLHHLAEARSLALHREIARRLGDEPALLEGARARVRGWLERGEVHVEYARAWAAWLDAPLAELLARLVADDDEARAMRQVTPFAGVVDARTRWRIWREVRRDLIDGTLGEGSPLRETFAQRAPDGA